MSSNLFLDKTELKNVVFMHGFDLFQYIPTLFILIRPIFLTSLMYRIYPCIMRTHTLDCNLKKKKKKKKGKQKTEELVTKSSIKTS